MSSTSQTSTEALQKRIVVTIDGPAGAGKSTIAKHLASRFGLLNLESGAMYRAFALKTLRMELPLDQSEPIESLAASTTILLEPGDDGNRVLLDGEDVTGLIRNPIVTDAASRVSVLSPIRAWMVRQQQQLGANGGVIMEGRDIGTVVFPHADVKIFLDANAETRGQRRFDQMGAPSSLNRAEVVRDLRQRDERDRNRLDSPLKPADDAIHIDSTNLTLPEVIAEAEKIVLARIQ